MTRCRTDYQQSGTMSLPKTRHRTRRRCFPMILSRGFTVRKASADAVSH